MAHYPMPSLAHNAPFKMMQQKRSLSLSAWVWWGQKPCSNNPGSDKDHSPFTKPSRLWSLCLGCSRGSSVWRQKQRVEAEACGQQYSRCRPGSSRGRRGQSPGGVRGSPGDTPASTSHTATAVPPCHTPHTILACPATTAVASL